MRKNRKLKGFPQPYSDETLSSWLFRCASSKRCVLTMEAVEHYVKSSLHRSIDYDFRFGKELKRLCCLFDIDYGYCKEYFSVRNVHMFLDVYSRNSFCRQCLDEDVKYRSSPYWRRSWCYLDVAYCAVHKSLLTTTREDYGIFRAWKSFAHYPDLIYQRKGSHLAREFPSLDCLGFRVQNWLWTNRVIIQGRVNSAKIIECLLSSFLSLRTKRRNCGIARKVFSNSRRMSIEHEDYHYKLCMQNGAKDSTALQRKAALIFLGILAGLYSERELQRIKNTGEYDYYPFPVTPAEVGFVVSELLSEREVHWYLSRFFSAPSIPGLEVDLRLEEYLNGFKSRKCSSPQRRVIVNCS